MKKRNLLLAFDAFGTLFTPRAPITSQYGEIAKRYGIVGFSDEQLKTSFRAAFKDESKKHPNYGKAAGLNAKKWWTNVISKTFTPFLKNGQELPHQLHSELLTRFSTKDGYSIYPDVLPFFEMLRSIKKHPNQPQPWKWEQTVIGIITNSDDRVPGVLSSLGLKIGPRKVATFEQRSDTAGMDDDVDFVVLSYDVGYEKPDRRIFDVAKMLLGEILTDKISKNGPQSVDDFDLLYVGDEVEKDYLGAKAAGWNAVLVDREGRYAGRLSEDMAVISVEITPGQGVGELRTAEVLKDLRALSAWSSK